MNFRAGLNEGVLKPNWPCQGPGRCLEGQVGELGGQSVSPNHHKLQAAKHFHCGAKTPMAVQPGLALLSSVFQAARYFLVTDSLMLRLPSRELQHSTTTCGLTSTPASTGKDCSAHSAFAAGNFGLSRLGLSGPVGLNTFRSRLLKKALVPNSVGH